MGPNFAMTSPDVGQTHAPGSQGWFTSQATAADRLSRGLDSPEFALIKRAERNRVGGEFGALQQGLQKSIHRRGIGRSGFAAELMSRLGAQQAGALADVEAGTTERLADYQAQYRALFMQQQMERRAKKAAKQRRTTGAALGVAGLVLAPFTGGASLALAGAGAGMYGS